MKGLLTCFVLLSLLVNACGPDKRTAKRQSAYKQAQVLIAAGNLGGAYSVLDTTLSFDTEPAPFDSLYYLHADLGEIENPENLEAHALELERIDGGWKSLASGTYTPEYFHFPASIKWATPALLREKGKLPALLIKRKQEEKAAAIKRVQQAKQEVISAAQAPLETRIKAGEAMREVYLDNNQDVEVTVTGKNKEVITLSYVLIGNVWSHHMNKEGTLDQLFDLGFKKIILTDGYDYRHTWTRNN